MFRLHDVPELTFVFRVLEQAVWWLHAQHGVLSAVKHIFDSERSSASSVVGHEVKHVLENIITELILFFSFGDDPFVLVIDFVNYFDFWTEGAQFLNLLTDVLKLVNCVVKGSDQFDSLSKIKN